MFDYLLDIQRVRQYMNWPLRAGMVWDATRSDLRFLRQLRTGLLPLPTDRPRDFVDPFPPFTARQLDGLSGKRVALIGTGGSGALASMVGVARVLEEAGIAPVAYGVCSGSALFGIPLAAGMSPAEVARATLSLTARDYIDPDWLGAATAPWRLMRGWVALVRGDKLEATYREILGDMTLGDLPTPVWLPVWNIERNHLEYLGPDTHPELSAARAVRMAVALPLALEPNALDGGFWLDGGIVDILPAQPFVDTGRCDAAIVVNAFYGPGFTTEEEPHWREAPLSVLHVANQTRTMQHLHLARRSYADLQRSVPEVLELSPVPYEQVHGAGLYGQFLDTRDWPEFMTDGYEVAARTLGETFGPPQRH